jgi:pyruvate/2-oxoglutarate dehydrogenase complex dihydrolipoamide acyltransferase (E2) component
MSMVAMAPGRSQPAPAPPPAAAQPAAPDQPAPPQSPPAAAPENPGLINEMGKVLEKSLSILPTLKGTGEALDDLNARAKDAAKDAGESLSRLTKPSSIATGRIVCPVSVNGASDCKLAADKLCLAKGFKEGKSLTTDSVQACSPKVLIPGRARKPDDCRTDNYVTRALCQ